MRRGGQAEIGDGAKHALEGQSEFVKREDILLPDRQSAERATVARRNNLAAVSAIPLEYVDETLEFSPEWIGDRIPGGIRQYLPACALPHDE